MKIAANSLRTYIFRIVTGFIGWLIGLFITWFLGVKGKGDYSGIFLYYSTYILIFGNLGGAIVNQITRRQRSPKSVFINASLYSLLLGLLTIIAFLIYNAFVPHPHLIWLKPAYVWPLLSIIPFALVLSNLSGVLQGLDRITTLNWVTIISGLFQLILLGIGFLGIIKFNVKIAIIIWFVAQILSVLISLWISKPYWLPPWKKVFDYSLLLGILGLGWQIGFSNIVAFFNSRIDSFMVQGTLARNLYGIYSIAVNGAEILWYASGAIAIAICAHVCMASDEEAAKLTTRAIRHTLFLNTILCILMWLGAPLIFKVYDLYKSNATATSISTMVILPFRVLLPGVLAFSIAGIFSTFFTTRLGQPKIPFLISFVSLLIDFSLCLLLIPKIGLLGGAIANSTSYIISISLYIIIFCKKTQTKFTALFKITREDIGDYKKLFQAVQRFLGRKLFRRGI